MLRCLSTRLFTPSVGDILAQFVRLHERIITMPTKESPDQLVGILRETVVALVRRAGPDLSARQLGVFLTCYLDDGPHTVRGLAAGLNVSKPAITRALDRLGEFDLARRKVDPMDRRSVLVQRTLKGSALLRDLRGIMGDASSNARKAGAAAASGTRRSAGN
jgi:DNA-binding MarR family transcriptional regulator